MAEQETLRVHIPLTLRNRGGRPRILPPKEIEVAMDRGQDARLLRAIGRAWAWRQGLERGDVNTIADLAREEGISDRYVSRVIRLAWLCALRVGTPRPAARTHGAVDLRPLRRGGTAVVRAAGAGV
jgi:hypothetical protein